MTFEDLININDGIYTINDAIALTGLSYAKVRHWIRGDKRSGDYLRKGISPIIQIQHGIVDGVYVLGFLDLVELLMIKKFNESGISIRGIRLMHENAQRHFNHSHPFAFEELYTAGKDIIASIDNDIDDKDLLNLRNSNLELKEITECYLKNIDFDGSDNRISKRWWPIGRDENIVIDPRRSKGHPILADSGVSTFVLASALMAEKNIGKVAEWYRLSEKSIEQAFAYETEVTKRIAA